MTKYLLFILTLIAFTLSIHAQQQITHFQPGNLDPGSNPSEFVEYNDHLIFQAHNRDYGYELWITNGIEAPYLLKDINPGRGNGVLPGRGSGVLHGVNYTSFKEETVSLNGLLYFIAKTNDTNYQIWSTDGTESGTAQVTELIDATIYKLTLVGNEIYFLNHRTGSTEVWKSDGTANGTTLIQNNLPEVGFQTTYEGAANDLYFFTLLDQGEYQIWRSNGTEAGTFEAIPKKDATILEEKSLSPAPQIVTYKNELYFVAKSDLFSPDLKNIGILKTDGSSDNIQPIKSMFEGVPDFSDVIEINNKLYFSFFSDSTNDYSIWESDGTEIGTFKIYEEIIPPIFIPSTLSSNDNNLIFLTRQNFENYSLFELNTQDHSVKEIAKIPQNSNSYSSGRFSEPNGVTELANNTIYLDLYGDGARNAWIVDLPENSVRDIDALNGVATFRHFGERYYFSKNTFEKGDELWQSNLSFDSISLFANVNADSYGLSPTKEPLVIGNKLFFESAPNMSVYDHNSGIQTLLDKIAGVNPINFTSAGNKLYYHTNVQGVGPKVLSTDGSYEGTIAPDNLNPNLINLIRPGIVHFKNNTYYFALARDTNEYHLAKHDSNGFELGEALPGPFKNDSFGPQEIVASSEYMYFIFRSNSNTDELWRSDGIDGGIVKLLESEKLRGLTVVGNMLYFSGKGKKELWISDGTPQGTKLVINTEEREVSQINGMVSFKNKLMFSAYTPEFGTEIWVSDGTSIGTYQIVDINEGENHGVDTFSGAFANKNHTILNDVIYFTADDGKLWRTDGTAEGTFPINDLLVSYPTSYKNDGERIYFSGYTNEYGRELWTSDGTATGTYQLFDLKKGALTSDPSSINIIENHIYFNALTAAEGFQLWKYHKNDDDDSDGVINILDRCPNTPPQSEVDAKGCFVKGLPSDNFTILTKSASCRSTNNGSIEISAKKQFDYQIKLTGESLSLTKKFKETIVLSDLSAGTYDLCIGYTSEGDFIETCYLLQITEPEALEVTSKINSSNNTLSLKLYGANMYYVTLNDKVYQTSKNELTVALSTNENKLSVTTEKECQGKFEENIMLSSNTLIYPNPIEKGNLNVGIGQSNLDYVPLSIFTMNGKMIMSKPHKVYNKEVFLNVDGLKKGVYLISLKTEENVIVHKLIKN